MDDILTKLSLRATEFTCWNRLSIHGLPAQNSRVDVVVVVVVVVFIVIVVVVVNSIPRARSSGTPF